MIAALLALAAGATQALALADPWTGQAHGWLQVGGLAVLVALLFLGLLLTVMQNT